MIAGLLLPVIKYEGVFLGTAGLILLSIPFALAMKVQAPGTSTNKFRCGRIGNRR